MEVQVWTHEPTPKNEVPRVYHVSAPPALIGFACPGHRPA